MAVRLELAHVAIKDIALAPNIERRRHPLEAAVALRVIGHRQSIIDIAGRGQEDKVVDVVIEEVGLGANSPARMAQAEINAVTAFSFEVGVSDLEGRVARV